MIPTDIYDATIIQTRDRKLHRIIEKWGVDGRRLAKPSEGGFGCVTSDGLRIDMWSAFAYYREDDPNPEAFMATWVVYSNPKDFPGKYVARRWDIIRGQTEPKPTSEHHVADTLEEIRKMIPDRGGLACIPRYDDDDYAIVEMWI